MQYAFVRFVAVNDGSGGNVLLTLAEGKEAASHQNFIDLNRDTYGPIQIVSWFDVPKNWMDAHIGDLWLNNIFHALLKLDELSPSEDDRPAMRLFVTIFEAGFKCGEGHSRTETVNSEF